MASGIFTQRQVQREIIKGSWSNLKTPAVEYLVVAGGGAGATDRAGGGGAGGLLQGLTPITVGTSYTVTIGAGGSAAPGSANPATGNGQNSVFGPITSLGGGGGSGGDAQVTGGYITAASGGSGGGASTGGTPNGFMRGGQGTFGQGNNGGSGGAHASPGYNGGGGGGAGFSGLNGSQGYASGQGGAGIASDISGNRTVYAGGGGGGTYGGTAGPGGVGGGGAGAGGTGGTPGTSGTTNTGGGGGGGGGASGVGGSGGSGIVIVSYPDTYANAASQTNGTYSTSGSGSMYFNNPAGVSNQAVTYSNATATTIGANDFCIEAFVWWSSSSGAAPYIATNYSGSTNYYWGLYQQTTIGFYVYGGVYLNAGAFTNDAWNHIVVCRTSGTTSMFLNGTRTATASDSVTYASSSTVYVGQNNLGTNFLNGYLSNFRIVVGSSIYSAAATTITVPTTPFVGTSQTKMLLSSVSPNAYLDSSASALTPTLVSNTGSVTWNQFSPFTTTGYKNRVYTWTSSGTITF